VGGIAEDDEALYWRDQIRAGAFKTREEYNAAVEKVYQLEHAEEARNAALRV
jgi:hypothetical protein